MEFDIFHLSQWTNQTLDWFSFEEMDRESFDSDPEEDFAQKLRLWIRRPLIQGHDPAVDKPGSSSKDMMKVSVGSEYELDSVSAHSSSMDPVFHTPERW